jgi:hypothetical protein
MKSAAVPATFIFRTLRRENMDFIFMPRLPFSNGRKALFHDRSSKSNASALRLS